MLGIWKSFDELEASVSLPELDLIIKTKREEDRMNKNFLAAIQGIDLEKNDKESSDGAKRLEDVKRRAQARLAGGEEEVERQELAELGFKFKSA